MSNWVIYTLEDPRGGGVRYVGKTHRNPNVRLNQHLSNARTKGWTYHQANWIRVLLRDGVKPILTIIETGSGGLWGEAEARWISHYSTAGCRLTNATTGGEGAPGHKVSPEARAKMSAARKGRPLSAEHKAKIAAGNRGKKMSPEAIAKTAAFWRGRKHSPETKARISLARKGKKGWKPTPEQAAKRGVAIRERMASEEWVDPRLGRSLSAEHKAKISVANRGRKWTAEARARFSKSKTGKPRSKKVVCLEGPDVL